MYKKDTLLLSDVHSFLRDVLSAILYFALKRIRKFDTFLKCPEENRGDIIELLPLIFCIVSGSFSFGEGRVRYVGAFFFSLVMISGVFNSFES